MLRREVEELKATIVEKDKLLAMRNDGEDMYKSEAEHLRSNNTILRSHLLRLALQINDIRDIEEQCIRSD